MSKLISQTLVADKTLAEMVRSQKPVFEFRPIKSRGRAKLHLDFDALQKAYDKLNEIKDETVEITDENMYEAFYNLGLNQGKELSEEISEEELDSAYARGEEHGRTQGAKNVLKYLIGKVEKIKETDRIKQELDTESLHTYDFALTLLKGELNKFYSYDEGESNG